MKVFELIVTEIREKLIEIESETIEDAVSEAYERYGEGNIRIEDSDLSRVRIEEFGK